MVAVHPQARRRGVGSAVCRTALVRLKDRAVTVVHIGTEVTPLTRRLDGSMSRWVSRLSRRGLHAGDLRCQQWGIPRRGGKPGPTTTTATTTGWGGERSRSLASAAGPLCCSHVRRRRGSRVVGRTVGPGAQVGAPLGPEPGRSGLERLQLGPSVEQSTKEVSHGSDRFQVTPSSSQRTDRNRVSSIPSPSSGLAPATTSSPRRPAPCARSATTLGARRRPPTRRGSQPRSHGQASPVTVP